MLRTQSREALPFFTPKTCLSFVVLTTIGAAGGVFVGLGAFKFFGVVGSKGFIASIAGGGTTVVIAVAGFPVTIICRLACRESKVDLPTDIDPLPEVNQHQQAPAPVPAPIQQNNGPAAPIINHGSSKSKKPYKERRKAFKEGLNARLGKQPTQAFRMPDFTLPNFQHTLTHLIGYFSSEPSKGSGIRTFGKRKSCLATQEIPGVIFKRARTGCTNDQHHYFNKAQQVKRICEENDLFMLYVPECAVLTDFDCVAEEEFSPIGNYAVQKAIFTELTTNPHWGRWGKTIFQQLLIFVCKSHSSNIGPDNISFNRDGRLILHSINEGGAVEGVMRLFGMLPLSWYDEFIGLARENLDEAKFEQFEKNIVNLRKRAEKRDQMRKHKIDFYSEKAIVEPENPLLFDRNDFDPYEKNIGDFAELTIQEINKQLPELHLHSMAEGRVVTIAMDRGSPISDRFWKDGCVDFSNVLKPSLDALQREGYIFSYEIGSQYKHFTVVC